MKICVIGGGGAIGGYLAVMLARAGNEVTVVARGATLAAIKERGLALIWMTNQSLWLPKSKQ
nr:2-dehydropantoate 2-reductase N-terminal domain-containing protein [Polynucleobacter necessarius]